LGSSILERYWRCLFENRDIILLKGVKGKTLRGNPRRKKIEFRQYFEVLVGRVNKDMARTTKRFEEAWNNLCLSIIFYRNFCSRSIYSFPYSTSLALIFMIELFIYSKNLNGSLSEKA